MTLDTATLGSTERGPRRWKWTGDDLIRLGSLGLLPPEQKFELMDGEIIEIMPPNPLHATLVDLIAELLAAVFSSDGVHVRHEKPLRLNRHYDPQPDVMVVTGERRAYMERFPTPEEVLLLIEVADTSLEYDRTDKLSAYAAAGIADYWIVNLRDMQVEVYRDPSGTEYLSRRIFKLDDSVSPLAAPGASLPVAALLGR